MSEPEYRVELLPAARRDFNNLPDHLQQRIIEGLRALKTNPRPKYCCKLADTEDAYRLRVSNYRIIYRIKDKDRIVLVGRIRHRREVYRSR